jgi:isoamylase
MKLLPGQPYPLGATWDGAGVNIAVFSQHAEAVELCLFEGVRARREVLRIALPQKTQHVWHGYFPELRPGQLYGFRVYGPYRPEDGHRFNPKKVLLDPYAKAVARTVRWYDSMFGYRLSNPKQDLMADTRDNAPYAPLGVVIEPAFSWGDDKRPNIPLNETVLYEAHLKGLTALHPKVPARLRGTYAGLACEPVIKHLKQLGITSVELLPVHASVDEGHLAKHGLNNYWGYNTLGYFAPEPGYSASSEPQEQVNEFKTMVRTLHAHGLEVILDVVYNHTCEGNHLGPMVSFKGLDNLAYYRLVSGNARYYMDFTGCGNTLDLTHPNVLQLVMDSLRYWVTEMHIDGFRFDLTSSLGREHYDFDPRGSFFDAIHQDPVLSQVKLLAEPWDVGVGGYQVGNYPVRWCEWNGPYRDTIREFWNLQTATLSTLATRLSGSSDMFQHNGRSPHQSINFVTCHDGFTLADLVSYNQKHNEANGEDNRDGSNDNRSWNCGVEGSSTDPAILALRARQKRNMLATLLLSLGVPMLSHGDELSQSKQGNNNTYCQDNELSWLNWHSHEDPDKAPFLAFTQRLIALRKQEAVFKRASFFRGEPSQVSGIHDILWFSPDGHDMTVQDWHNPNLRTVGMVLEGSGLDTLGPEGTWLSGNSLLVLINGKPETIPFLLPSHREQGEWEVLLTTTTPTGEPATGEKTLLPAGASYLLEARSVVVLRLNAKEDAITKVSSKKNSVKQELADSEKKA